MINPYHILSGVIAEMEMDEMWVRCWPFAVRPSNVIGRHSLAGSLSWVIWRKDRFCLYRVRDGG